MNTMGAYSSAGEGDRGGGSAPPRPPSAPGSWAPAAREVGDRRPMDTDGLETFPHLLIDGRVADLLLLPSSGDGAVVRIRSGV